MSQRQVDPIVLNVAKFLRSNEILKQRQGLLQGNIVDFFRFKRASRALLSDAYKKKQENPKNNLPPITNEAEARDVFIQLIKNQLVHPGEKLSTAKAKENQLVPKKGTPCFLPVQKAELKPDEYYIWFYKEKNPWEFVMGLGVVVGIFTLILFPLWPLFMRKGVWYLSMGLLGLIALFFVIAIIRLIVFLITYVILSPGLWIFPNLFEDCGFFDSFKPLYAWNLPKEKKSKKSKKAQNKSSAQSPAAPLEQIKQSKQPNGSTTTSSKPNESSNVKRKATLEEVDE